ncbi:MAG TPA: hypothetical protein VNX25_02680 [Verrucomicrobiae bacterium]|nr:hypothetical protein [Verrucomicrobiae bacterium]
MFRLASICLAAVLLCGAAAAQDTPPAPDLEFRSRVRAREMVFDAVTTPTVRFRGTPGRSTVDRSIRKNLPKPVEPGRVYRDVEVETEIGSTFPNVSTALRPLRRKPGPR